MFATLAGPWRLLQEVTARRRAALPRQRSARAIAIHTTEGAPFVEQFRLLALNLLALLKDSDAKTVAIFSPYAGDGRSLVSVNLGLALAAHTDVLLVHSDPHSSETHHEVLPSTDAVVGSRELVKQDYVSTGRGGLWLLPAQTQLMGRAGELSPLVVKARGQGMFVIADAPAAEKSSDAFLVAERAQNVLYVLRNRPQDMETHRRMIEHLKRLGFRVLGFVVNDN
jgi:Mrp family chromosome partitioning ATPase